MTRNRLVMGRPSYVNGRRVRSRAPKQAAGCMDRSHCSGGSERPLVLVAARRGAAADGGADGTRGRRHAPGPRGRRMGHLRGSLPRQPDRGSAPRGCLARSAAYISRTACGGKIDAWLSSYPETHRDGLIARFRATIDYQHRSAFFELFLYHLLLARGCKMIEIEPKLMVQHRVVVFPRHAVAPG
jgi:hypothetical protein